MQAATRATSDPALRVVRPRALRPARLLVVTVPLAAVLAIAGLLLASRDYNGRRASVVADTQLLARAAAADADRFLRDRIAALTVLADSPTVRSGDRPAMQAYFRALASDPTYARLSWFDLSGLRRASNLEDPPGGPLNVNSRAYFQAVVATQQPYVDAAVTSLQDSSPIITVAVPTFDQNDQLSGVLINPLTLDLLENILKTFRGPDSVVLVVDRANQVIADGDPKTGFQPLGAPDVITRARQQGSGAFSDVSGPLGNRNRLIGFAPAPAGDWLVLVSRSADSAFAPARRSFIIELLAIAAITLVGIGSALLLTARLNREATARERAHEADSRLAAIVGSSGDAIIGLTQDGLITSWNAGAEQMFDLSGTRAFGRPIASLLRSDRAGDLAAVLQRLRRGEATQQFEATGVRGDGTAVELALTFSPVRNAAGAILGASVIARDISEAARVAAERERLLEREHELRREAEAANRAKDEFLSTISHELRTPLTTIVGYAQLLRRRVAADPDTAQMAATIDRSAHLQIRLVNDLLDLSRVVGGKLEIEREPVELAALVEATVASARPEAEAKAIALTVQIDDPEAVVQGDAARLQQILANLLGNALKFTPSGGSVAVALSRVGGEARVAVRDSGIGIPAAFLPHVFERFRQADASPTRAFGGLGLGLTIAQMLADLHGGRITAESAGEGKGATFTLWLPLSAAPVDAESESPPSATLGVHDGAPPRLAGASVLVVEDDPDTRELLRRILEAEAARVVTAASGAEALAALEQATPSVLVCDIGMPGEDGYAVLQRLRSRRGDLPAIALTAYAGPEDRERAHAAGFQRHLAKPVDPPVLISAIAALLRADGVRV
jgi:PAS domain S-box-containing protein